MSAGKTWATAGLVFLESRDLDIVEAANLVASAFETLGQRVHSVHIHSDTNARVATTTHRLKLCIDEEVSLRNLNEAAAILLSVRIAATDAKSASRSC